ncbi:hypothetical protein G6F59_015915 [Rhizopus arrhizus]|nr:hypothetical protein G6F59_015915 [Rhizopus arrhizus]
MPGGDVALQVLVENRRGHVGRLAEVLLVGQVQCGGTPGVQQRITATAAGAAIVGIHAELQAGAHLVHARACHLLGSGEAQRLLVREHEHQVQARQPILVGPPCGERLDVAARWLRAVPVA